MFEGAHRWIDARHYGRLGTLLPTDRAAATWSSRLCRSPRTRRCRGSKSSRAWRAPTGVAGARLALWNRPSGTGDACSHRFSHRSAIETAGERPAPPGLGRSLRGLVIVIMALSLVRHGSITAAHLVVELPLTIPGLVHFMEGTAMIHRITRVPVVGLLAVVALLSACGGGVEIRRRLEAGAVRRRRCADEAGLERRGGADAAFAPVARQRRHEGPGQLHRRHSGLQGGHARSAPCQTADARYVVSRTENELHIAGVGMDPCGGRRAALVGTWTKS